MTGTEFKRARKSRGWTQCEVAHSLGVSQPYVALLEHQKRPFPAPLARKAVTLLSMSPTALPLNPRQSRLPQPLDRNLATDDLANHDLANHDSANHDLTRQLSALGYPGFAHVQPTRRRNPVEVLLTALAKDRLDARVAEALPWLLLEYGEMSAANRNWMLENARLHSLTNRLGFTVTLAKQVAERSGKTPSNVHAALSQLEQELFRTRLAETDTFCQSDLSPKQREWLENSRPETARRWNLLTNWRPQHLQYA